MEAWGFLILIRRLEELTLFEMCSSERWVQVIPFGRRTRCRGPRHAFPPRTAACLAHLLFWRWTMQGLNLKNTLWNTGLFFWGDVCWHRVPTPAWPREQWLRDVKYLLFRMKFLNHIHLSQSHQGTAVGNMRPSLFVESTPLVPSDFNFNSANVWGKFILNIMCSVLPAKEYENVYEHSGPAHWNNSYLTLIESPGRSRQDEPYTEIRLSSGFFRDHL